MRRAMFWVMPVSVILLPLWVVFGRALFGVPLGAATLGQALLAPLLAVLMAFVVGATIARKEVRRPRSVTWHDIRAIGPWLIAIALVALVVVDGSGSQRASVITLWFGDSFLTLSQALTAILSIAIVLAGLMLVVVQVRLLMRETRLRVSSYLDSLGAVSPSPVMRDATFSPTDRNRAPQAGTTIRIDPAQPSE